MIKLKDVCDIIGDGLHGTPVFSDNGNYYFVNGNNLSNGKIKIYKDTKKCDESQYNLYKKDLTDRTILLSINGTIGNLAYYNGESIILGKSACFLNIKKEYDKRYMYYIFLDRKFQQYIKEYATGTTIKNTGLQTIRNFEFELPKKEEQKAIADVLSSFDDKIELNNKIIKNLENQAQSVYKHWFIDFEFPNEEGKQYKSSGGKFKESELGLIPECWDCKNIGDVCTRLTKRVKDGKYEVLSAVNTGELVLSSDYFNKQVFSENISNYIIVPPFSFAYNPARANIGSIGMNKFNFDGCVSPIYIAVTFEKDYHWFWEILIKSEYFKEQIKTRSSGSVRQNFDFNSFSTIKIAYPKAEVIKNFNLYYNTFNEQIVKTKIENKKLEETRDYLLQKLMNGEIKVSDVK